MLAVIDPTAMQHIATSLGLCNPCELDAATWTGNGSRLFVACHQREVRRGLEAGEMVSGLTSTG